MEDWETAQHLTVLRTDATPTINIYLIKNLNSAKAEKSQVRSGLGSCHRMLPAKENSCMLGHMSQSPRAAITKYHGLGGLHDRYLCLGLEAGSPRPCASSLRLSDDGLLGFWMAALSLCPHTTEKEHALSSTLIGAPIPSWGSHPHGFI